MRHLTIPPERDLEAHASGSDESGEGGVRAKAGASSVRKSGIPDAVLSATPALQEK